MAPGTQADDWWENFGVVPEWFGLYAGLEATASRIRKFEAELVPGLLQTAEYAELVVAADDPRMSPEAVARRIRFRTERQRTVLDTKPTPAMTFVLAETALLFGPPEVMAPQFDHLLSLDARANLDVFVLPFSSRTYPRRGGFTLLDFEDNEDPSLVYVEVPNGARYFDQPAEREDYEYVFGIIAGKSVPIKEWTMTETPWIKATRSGQEGDCVEMRRNGRFVEVRDTKDNGAGPTLRFTEAEFAAWLDGAKKGEFDHLV